MRKLVVFGFLWILLLTLAKGAAAQGNQPPYDPVYDVNSDCQIDLDDINLVITDWGASPPINPAYDVNGDGLVNVVDVQLVAAHWGTSCSTGEQGFVIDHNAVTLFDQIPDSYLQAARAKRVLFRHASVGDNINLGLNCLWNYFPGTPNPNVRPYACDRGLQPGQIVYDPKYNRSNWMLEFHNPPPGINPAWWNKVNLFISRVNNLGPGEIYDVVSFKFGYVDGVTGSYIDDVFFTTTGSPRIHHLEELQAQHPDKTLVLWTMGLARAIGTPDSLSFNQQMRSYAVANQKILMDIADITSHRLDGTSCFDNIGNGIEAICDEYTDENEGGHLNALGMQRMAKAFWVLMARLAGWDGTAQQP